MPAVIEGFVTRSEAGLRAPRSRSFNIAPQHGGTTVHYAGSAQKVSAALSGHSRCVALWKAYQDYHMDTKGWVDIAYTGGFCQHGYAFAGRGVNVRTAANGTPDGNSYYYAVVWIGGGTERPTQAALNALAWWVATLREEGGAGMRAVPHSFHKNTACPGSYLKTEASKLDNQSIDKDQDMEKVPQPDWISDEIIDRLLEARVLLNRPTQEPYVVWRMYVFLHRMLGAPPGSHDHSHDHDGRYAVKSHSHSHTHDDRYATVGHSHDGGGGVPEEWRTAFNEHSHHQDTTTGRSTVQL